MNKKNLAVLDDSAPLALPAAQFSAEGGGAGEERAKPDKSATQAAGDPESGGPSAPDDKRGRPMGRLYKLVYKNFVEPLVLSKNPPWLDARGVSLGLIIGFVIPVGGQLLALGLLRVVMRFNLMASVAFSFVSNPFNMIPLYYGYYRLGSFVLGRPVAMDEHMFCRLMNPIMNADYFWESLSMFAALGLDILCRWLVAAVILAVVGGVIGYVVTLKVQTNRCRAAAKRMGVQYEEFLAELEQGAHSNTENEPRAEKP